MQKQHTLLLFFLTCLCLFTQSCISRLRRPEITGVVVDYEKKPIHNCKVGEVLTDANGKFTLPELRYNAFFLTEIFAMEAPPLMVYETIEKAGFEKDALSIFNSRGGGQPAGAKSVIDTIFLRKIDQQFDIHTMLKKSRWHLGFNKNADTLLLVKDGYKEWCKTDRCSDFFSTYEGLTDVYYSSNKNLPKGMIRRMISLTFGSDQPTVTVNRVCEYISTFKGPNKKPDTLNTKGTWQLNHQTINLNIIKMPEISGSFKISDTDLYQMKLTRLKYKIDR